MEVHKWLEEIDFYEHNPEIDSIDLVGLLPIYIWTLRDADLRQHLSLQRQYDQCSKLISMNLPDGARDYRERATLLMRAQMFNEARVDLDAAIQLDPNNLEYHIDRGDLLFSIEDFIIAVRSDPVYQNYARRGQAYEQIGNIDAALADYEKVLKMKERHNTVRPRYEALIRKTGRTK